MNNFFFWLFTITPFAVWGQNTTQEEYNYLTNGIRAQLTNGFATEKEGYTLVNSTEHTVGDYFFNFIDMYRTKDKSHAGTCVIIKSDVSGRTYYICLPAGSRDAREDFDGNKVMNQIDDLSFDRNISRAFSVALAQRSDNLLHMLVYDPKLYEIKKKKKK